MGRSSEALSTTVGVLTSSVRQDGGDTTVVYTDTLFVADTVTSLDGDTESNPGGAWLVETWQQVAIASAVAVVLVAAALMTVLFMVGICSV